MSFHGKKKAAEREKMDANRYRNEKNLDINVKILYCLIVA
jgi:cytidylate kinase